jgi:hypothetical protein
MVVRWSALPFMQYAGSGQGSSWQALKHYPRRPEIDESDTATLVSHTTYT